MKRLAGGRRLAALALAACAAFASAAASANPGVLPAGKALLEQGRAVYNFRCYYCHGYSGDAKTLAAGFLTPPPADFTAHTARTLPLAKIEASVRDGRDGTAMKAFRAVIPESEIRAVAWFVFDEFVRRKAANTRYHTAENGWPDHGRYRAAFPFATGEIALTVPPESLDPATRAGRALFLKSCVSCHDRGKPDGERLDWQARPLSYPRHNYDHRRPEVDAATSATPYHLHDRPPHLAGATASVRRGERLFQDNCAFCHAADGTGKNWIGRFMEPPARDLTDPRIMQSMTRTRLAATIRDGLPNTSMPAWKSVLSAEEIEALIDYIDRAFHSVKK
jgi:cytochrome c oxidase cbb3-type subunit 3